MHRANESSPRVRIEAGRNAGFFENTEHPQQWVTVNAVLSYRMRDQRTRVAILNGKRGFDDKLDSSLGLVRDVVRV